jgi:hypothetical protein
MVYALIVGGVLGANNVGILPAIPVLLGLVGLKGIAEIMFKRSWLTGGPSPYALYLEQLGRQGSVSGTAWAPYLAQVLLFGALLGAVGFVIGRLVF